MWAESHNKVQDKGAFN